MLAFVSLPKCLALKATWASGLISNYSKEVMMSQPPSGQLIPLAAW
jgi:hypothetical protein